MNFLPEIKCDLTPLVQSIPNGVEKIFKLLFGTKVTKQEAARRLISAQAERNARLIGDGTLILNEQNQFIDFDKIGESNVEQCIEFAIKEAMLRNDEPAVEDISKTFFYKWRDYAKSIDENDIKQLWGRLLTNEIYEPNSVSLRFLNALSMLSRKDIDVFIDSTPYIIGSGYLAVDFIPVEKKKEIFSTLFAIGAIAEIPKSGIKAVERLIRYTKNGFNYSHISQRSNLIAFHDESNEEDLLVEFVALTEIGLELYRLTEESDSEYITLCNSISKEVLSNKTINKISVYKIENNSVTDTLFEKEL
ncbi:MAG: DUF2806 domain-containing protein [Moraxella sp.]|nr:DUF2806 domain-containing protein [Moraxella sp.]